MIDVVVLFFLLGVFAKLVKSDLRLPEALYETLSIYLLLAIGLKGGIELSKQPMLDLLPQMLACMALGFAIPFVLTPVLRALGLNRVDAASMAAHYGSVSVVTFAVASAYLAAQGIETEAHAALWVAIMEAPGIVAGILLARLGAPAVPGASKPTINWAELGHDVFFGKSVLLLAGGLLIGTVMGEAGTAPIAPVFMAPFKGVLALFLLELGLVAGGRLGDLRRYGLRIIGFALIAPPLLAVLGALTGIMLGLSTGGVAIMATLAASASYIAAPTALRMAGAEANAARSLTAALGLTFPFNIVLGVPLYLMMARWLQHLFA
ncbi:MAG: sodium-dependent bicarbonate transport family permease [Hydrogenophaga sp.]|uniref:sodium-dependent bicarbonate transport family permease n=1 Tax=Hydrogenophaga sp. TaxID=1904254 RepID=UPI002AB890A5|nr:sodium-dependent bicarbonate transport family permease [Hydrogenophaga sp.]MDZ4187835.1 sodium-dependent bicarbonate transport family permease [Hydrogenophaga sp.]